MLPCKLKRAGCSGLRSSFSCSSAYRLAARLEGPLLHAGASRCPVRPGDLLPPPPSLKQTANRARGLSQASISISLLEPGVFGDLDYVLQYYNLAIVIPVTSAVTTDDDTIFTWYKFTVTDVISKAQMTCPSDHPLDPPNDLLPLAQKTLLFRSLVALQLLMGSVLRCAQMKVCLRLS